MNQEKRGKDQARYIKVNEMDNVAIIVNEGGLPADTKFPDGLVLIEAVPQGHKVALQNIEKDEPIVRYGEVIGYASRRLPEGSWVEESSVILPKAPDLDEVLAKTIKRFEARKKANKADGATENPAAQSTAASIPTDSTGSSDGRPQSELYFDGYRNADGSVGSKNMLGLIPSVQCVAGVLNVAARRIEKELLPRFPHVDGVVALNHSYGCGVAIGAPDAEIPIRTIRNLAAHPNFGGMPLIIGLGCEKLQPERIVPAELPRAPFTVDHGTRKGPIPPARTEAEQKALGTTIIRLQEQAGFPAMIEEIMRAAEARLVVLEQRRREPCPLSELVMGVQCGGSDAFSGVTANPAIGYASDLLVRAGATVMFSEVTEVRDAVQLLAPRAASPAVAAAFIREMRWYDEYLARGGADRSANTTPGNKKGGLANIVEKALGSSIKSGTSPLVGVLGPGERAPIYARGATGPVAEKEVAPAAATSVVAPRGLFFAATPASDFICGTLQLASGMHLQVFSTGRGTPYGLAMAPVIKVSSNSRLAHQWPNLIDIDAGRIAEGHASIEEVGKEIFKFIIDVASGRKKPWVDQYGLYNDLVLFNPGPVT